MQFVKGPLFSKKNFSTTLLNLVCVAKMDVQTVDFYGGTSLQSSVHGELQTHPYNNAHTAHLSYCESYRCSDVRSDVRDDVATAGLPADAWLSPFYNSCRMRNIAYAFHHSSGENLPAYGSEDVAHNMPQLLSKSCAYALQQQQQQQTVSCCYASVGGSPHCEDHAYDLSLSPTLRTSTYILKPVDLSLTCNNNNYPEKITYEDGDSLIQWMSDENGATASQSQYACTCAYVTQHDVAVGHSSPSPSSSSAREEEQEERAEEQMTLPPVTFKWMTIKRNPTRDGKYCFE